MKFKWSLILLLSSPGWVWAGGGLTYSHTQGSRSFQSNTVDANLDLGADFYLGGSFDAYSSDTSSGTINTYYLRLGRIRANGSWKLFGLITPEVSQYKAVGAGGEFRTAIFGRISKEDQLNPPLPYSEQNPYAATPPPSEWEAHPRLDLLGGYARTMYTDQGDNIDENDLMGGLGFNLYRTYLLGQFTKSFYDQEFTGSLKGFDISTHHFNVAFTPGLFPGYPDYSYTGTLDQTIVPGWWLSGSWTHVKYKAGPDDKADFYSVGGGARLFRHLLLSLMYTRYLPNNDSRQNFYSGGVGVQF